MRPDPEVLEDQAVQKNPVDLAVRTALVALGVQWSSVVPLVQREVIQKAQVAQVVAQWEVVM